MIKKRSGRWKEGGKTSQKPKPKPKIKKKPNPASALNHGETLPTPLYLSEKGHTAGRST